MSHDPESPTGFQSRRSLLQATATGIGIGGLAGCLSTQTNQETSTQTTPPPADNAGGEPVNNSTASGDEERSLPSTGQINAILEGEEPWPNQFFNGDVDLELGINKEELRRQHFDQYKEIAQGYTQFRSKKQGRILRQFPHKLTDPEWVEENAYQPIREKGFSPGDLFKEEKYTQDASLDTRMRESGYPDLWGIVEVETLGSGSSTYDYIMAAELAAAEKYTAGEDTVVAHTKTEEGTHGLVFPITNPTYDKDKLDQQETWGMDTDRQEEKTFGIWTRHLRILMMEKKYSRRIQNYLSLEKMPGIS